MATFIENLREFVKDPFAAAKSLKDYNLQQRWKKADFEGFEKAIDNGEIKTPESEQREFSTVLTMDNIYTDLSDKFQNYFYNKYKDESSTEEVPDEIIKKESIDFLKKEIKKRELDNFKFDNGKSFIENFYKYGYDEILLPDPDKLNNNSSSRRRTDNRPFRTTDGNWITGRRLNEVFPYRVDVPKIDNVKRQQENFIKELRSLHMPPRQ